MKQSFLFLLSLATWLSCLGQRYETKVESSSVFEKLSGLPLCDKYGEVSSVKVVYDLFDERLYFVNAKYYKFHHEFCSEQLYDEHGLDYFNEVNYIDDPRRRYLLGNVNYYKALNVYALELSPVDLMPWHQITQLYKLVAEHSFISDQLKLLLNNSRLNNLVLSQENSLPTISPSNIYGNLEYQAISKYEKCGTLRLIEHFSNSKDQIKPTDIIVINETPLILPEVSGIIVTEFQTPLSHITILGQNRKIPIAAYKSAFEDSTIIGLEDQNVCLQVSVDDFELNRTGKLKEGNKPAHRVRLAFDLEPDSVVGIENLKKRSYKYVGYKASNFGHLFRLGRKKQIHVPECAFAIPFHFYENHARHSGADSLIQVLVSATTKLAPDSLQQALKRIRKAIEKHPADSQLIKSINRKANSCSGFERLRFRSSTNAEDAPGFSGAGLYSSKTGILNDSIKSFERAIKKVWASLWSYGAYSERELFNIDHSEVYMGVLVHRSFPDEEVNGVAITRNLYREDNPGFVINAQIGNESVVNPSPGVTSEQFICYPNEMPNLYENRQTVDIITQSSLSDGKLIMSDEEIQLLANQLETIQRYFNRVVYPFIHYSELALDIEFKLDHETRKLYFKQVRIYNY